MRFSFFYLATISVLAISPSARADWKDWRGPTQDGRCEAAGLPLHWSETENVVWKTAIHDIGHSTPVILGKQAWLTTAKQEGTTLYAVCIDVDNGKIVHDVEVFTVADPQHINPSNSYATPSPVIEPGRVYVHYGSLGTACVDTTKGEVLWRRTDLNCDHMQGPASSPVLFEDLLIVTVEGTDKQFTEALETKTGKTVWHYDRPSDLYTDEVKGVYKKSYQTPVILPVDGRPQLISNGALLVTGHDPRTGAEIWRARYRDDSTVSRIIYDDKFLYVNTGGSPTGTELWAIPKGMKGDATDKAVWKVTKDAPHESSPVLMEGLIYGVSESKVMICIDAKTGELVWSQKMQGDFWSSFLTNGKRLYISNKKGTTYVLSPGREYKEVAVNQLDGEIFASPVVEGNDLLLRTKTHLYRIAEKK